MRKLHFLLTMSVLSGLYFLLVSNSNGRATNNNSGNTGAPGEATTCGGCHNAASYGAVTAQIQVFELGTTTPVLAYVPGTAYDMRVTINHTAGNPSGRGFQMTCLTVTGNTPLGGYSNLAPNVKQITLSTGPQAGRTYVEHNGVTSNNQFNFRWTAPATGLGSVRFYASGNAVNGNSGSSGDTSGSSNLTLPQAQPIAASAVVTNPNCFGQNTGSINQTVSGVAPFTFLWNDGATTEDLSLLAAGIYSVTITDAVGQTFQSQYTLVSPTAIVHQAQASDATIPGGQGSVTLTGSGGTGTLTYTIAGIGVVNNFPLAIAAGTYNYQVTDQLNCSATGTFTVEQPLPLAVDVAVQNVSCFGAQDGSLELISINGATAPYAIQWSADISNANLGPDVYFLTVTDAVGFELVFPFEVTEPAALGISAIFNPVNCFGQQAEVVVSATGGVAPYEGIGTSVHAAGTHAFIVTDSNGCVAQTEIEIVQPEELILTAVAPAIPCVGGDGEVAISAQGGTAPYVGAGTQAVITPGIYLYSVSDANGCQTEIQVVVEALDGPAIEISASAPTCSYNCDGTAAVVLTNAADPVTALWTNGSTSFLPDDLCSGPNAVTITDALGCVLTASVNVPSITPLDMTFIYQPVLCFGDSTQVEVALEGGTAPYNIQWPEGTGNLVVAGQYNVQVTDAEGCTYGEIVEILDPQPVVSSGFSVNPTCFGANDGVASVSVSGGTGIWTFNWSNGADESAVSNLGPGEYSCTASDDNGCTAILLFVLDEPLLLVIEVTEVNLEGATASILLDVTGGVSPYNLLITDADSNEFDGTNLTVPGTYTITATDANGCIAVLENYFIDNSVFQPIGGSDKVRAFPNPVSGWLTIDAPYVITNWAVITPQGTLFSEGKGFDSTLKLDTSNWPEGIYWLRIAGPTGQSVVRVIKL